MVEGQAGRGDVRGEAIGWGWAAWMVRLGV